MKRFILLALGTGLHFSGCSISKKEICAKWWAYQDGFETENAQKKLGLNVDSSETLHLQRYCSYYRS
tara:strand:- start:729 stop:929 length:201 start_codon:yes stop_codon:yes gene_type:complete